MEGRHPTITAGRQACIIEGLDERNVNLQVETIQANHFPSLQLSQGDRQHEIEQNKSRDEEHVSNNSSSDTHDTLRHMERSTCSHTSPTVSSIYTVLFERKV